MNIVGLTGGIASGKSTVGRLLAGWGVPVVDADVVAREVVEPGQPALAALVEAFGSEILDADGRLHRARMRTRMTSDPAARDTLTGITHPAIRRAIVERLMALAAEGHPHAVVEAALLVETGGYKLYPQLIVVSCAPELQVERVMARDDVDADAARAIIATQLPLADKEAVATAVIRNDADLAALEERTRSVWSELTA